MNNNTPKQQNAKAIEKADIKQLRDYTVYVQERIDEDDAPLVFIDWLERETSLFDEQY